MYFKLSAVHNDLPFSYLISKNPNATEPFKRDIGSADEGKRYVTGKFTSEREYEVIVHNDALFIMEGLRKLNAPSYVSAKAYAVLPFNLKGITETLRSAFAGKAGGVEQSVIDTKAHWACQIGPFIADPDHVAKTFENVGMTVQGQDFFRGQVTVVILKSAEPMTLREFLQRVYIGSMYLSMNAHDHKYLDDNQIRALMKSCSAWLASCPIKEFIIHKLTGGHKGFKEEFYNALVDDGAEADEEELDEPTHEPVIEREHEGKSFHNIRHQLMLDHLPDDAGYVVELGCGDGKMLAKLVSKYKRANIVGVEAEARLVRRARRRAKGATVTQGNITSLALEEGNLNPDVLIMTEVIEHMTREDRRAVINQILKVWQPKFVAISVPDIRYNEIIGLEEGQLRHGDHKIEYDEKTWANEIFGPLTANYHIETFKILPDAEIQPSFVMVGEHWDAKFKREHDLLQTELALESEGNQDFSEAQAKVDSHLADRVRASFTKTDFGEIRRMRDVHAPYHIESLGVTVAARDMQAGLVHDVFRNHRDRAFYLSPTMAPAEWEPSAPEYLEHPLGAMIYYAERNVFEVSEQPKEMGSRVSLMLFRTRDLARQMGYDHSVVALSRNGYPFFKKREHLDQIEEWAKPIWENDGGEADVVWVDGEVLPWSFKAGGNGGMIDSMFARPGQAALAYQTLTGGDTFESNAFLNALGHYSEPGTMRIKLFGFLGSALVSSQGFKAVQHIANLRPVEQIARLETLFANSGFEVVENHVVDLGDLNAVNRSIERWKVYTEKLGGEGFVYKPHSALDASNGRMIMRSGLKVRGRDYLRLIYGMNYLQPEFFEKVKRRNVKAKRRLALLEETLALRMFYAFSTNNRNAHERTVAAYLGVDNESANSVDATL